MFSLFLSVLPWPSGLRRLDDCVQACVKVCTLGPASAPPREQAKVTGRQFDPGNIDTKIFQFVTFDLSSINHLFGLYHLLCVIC